MGSFVNLEIASLNCNGLNDPSERKVLFDFLRQSSFSIIFLQETRFDPSQHCEIVKEWKEGPILLNSIFGRKCGTAILFNSSQIKIINDMYDKESRVISVVIEVFGNRFHLVNSYFPNDTAEKVPFIQNSYKYVMSNFPVIWGGDFNLTTDNMIDRWPRRSGRDTHSNELDKVLDTFNLVDVCRFFNPNQPMYTFKRKKNEGCVMSRIDKFFVSKHFELVEYNQVDWEFSDHEIINIQIQYQSKVVFGKMPWRNNTKHFKSENFLENFKKFWDELKLKKRAMYYGNINKWWNEAKYDVKRMLMNLGKSINMYEKREINMMRNTLIFYWRCWR